MTIPTPAQARLPCRVVRADGRRTLHVGGRLYSSSARRDLVREASVALGKVWSAEPIPLVQGCLQIRVEPPCQALDDTAENIAQFPKAVPFRSFRHANQCGVGAMRDGAQVVRA